MLLHESQNGSMLIFWEIPAKSTADNSVPEDRSRKRFENKPESESSMKNCVPQGASLPSKQLPTSSFHSGVASGRN